jgi:dephospho-CoA kinase
MKLIGLSGTNGAGKDSVAELLRDKYRFMFVSMSDLLRIEAERRGIAVERDNLRMISAEWRRESGLGVLIDKSVEMYQQSGAESNFDGLVVSSIRNPGEVDRVHELGGQVIWIDADPKIRYNRIFKRQRTDEDNKTFEQFLSEEQAEMQHSGDKATLNMSGVKASADFVIVNDSNSINELAEVIEKQIGGVFWSS